MAAMEKKDKTLNVPNLRFPEFSGEWERCTLGDFGNVITGNTPPTAEYENFDNGTHLWASPADLGTTKYIESTQTLLSDRGFEKSRSFPANSILVTCIGSTIGKMGMSKTEMASNQQINTIVPVQHDANFVYYAVQSRFPRYLSSIAVQAVPILSKSSFEKLTNYTTARKEQIKIGNLLSLIDERIDTQKKIIEKYESLIRGIVETHYSQCECIKQVRISELGEPFTTMNMSKEDLSEEGNECILYGELFTTYGCVIKEVKSRTHISTDKATISRSNDMLFPASTTVDAISLIAPSAICKEGVILGGDLFGIHVNKDYNNEYLSYLINYIYKSKLARYAQGSTIIHLHYSDIKKATLLLPTIEEQNYLAYLMRGVEEKIDIEKDMLSQLYRQKAYLLSSLFI